VAERTTGSNPPQRDTCQWARRVKKAQDPPDGDHGAETPCRYSRSPTAKLQAPEENDESNTSKAKKHEEDAVADTFDSGIAERFNSTKCGAPGKQEDGDDQDGDAEVVPS